MKITDIVQHHASSAPSIGTLEAFLSGTREGMFGEQGEWWMGPRLDPSSGNAYSEFLRRAKETFVVHNLLSLVQRNHLDAVLSREPEWTMRRGTGEVDVPLLSDWYRERDVQSVLYKAGKTLLATQGGPMSQSLLRYYVPRRAVRGGVVIPGPLVESLQRSVRLMHPSNTVAGVIDEDGDPVVGYYRYSEQDANGQPREILELTALDTEFAFQGWSSAYAARPAGLTVVQQRTGADWSQVIGEAAYPLGGKLTMFAMRREPLIGEDTLIQQASANTQWTYLNNFTSANTYLERIFLNALPPGVWTNKDGEEGPFSNEFNRFKPGAYRGGNGTTNFIGGVPTSEGGYTNPSVVMRTPSSSSPILENIEAHRHAIYDSCNQLHLLIAGDATATGVARVQAVQGFLNSLAPTSRQLKLGLRWALETGLDLAAHFSTDGAGLAGLDADVTLNARAVEKTSEERAQVLNELKSGVIDVLEAMYQLGYENTDELLDRVKLERAQAAARQRELFAGRSRQGEEFAP